LAFSSVGRFFSIFSAAIFIGSSGKYGFPSIHLHAVCLCFRIPLSAFLRQFFFFPLLTLTSFQAAVRLRAKMFSVQALSSCPRGFFLLHADHAPLFLASPLTPQVCDWNRPSYLLRRRATSLGLVRRFFNSFSSFRVAAFSLR